MLAEAGSGWAPPELVTTFNELHRTGIAEVPADSDRLLVRLSSERRRWSATA